jgi:hypothetical protein
VARSVTDRVTRHTSEEVSRLDFPLGAIRPLLESPQRQNPARRRTEESLFPAYLPNMTEDQRGYHLR